jgi:hypothetical protein
MAILTREEIERINSSHLFFAGEGLLHNGRGCEVTFVALIILVSTCKREIGNYPIARLLGIDIVFDVARIVHLKISCSTLRINDTKISFYAPRLWVGSEPLLEISYRSTISQRMIHEFTLAIHLAFE